MQRVLRVTADGSHTIEEQNMQVTYHSIHGAISESTHVFIEAGLKPALMHQQTIRIFEMGFGTGLNALLTFQQAIQSDCKIFYHAVELFPLKPNEYLLLNYTEQLNDKMLQPYFVNMHKSDWEREIMIHSLFDLYKSNQSLLKFQPKQLFDLIYFDAFAPKAQPELWTREVFEKMFLMLRRGGILVTYCSKGDVRRAMLAAGFKVEKLPGPSGKREMLRAKA